MWLVEARTVLGRARVRALLVVLAAVPVFLVVAVYLSGGPAAGNGPAFVDRVSHNAVFAALAALTVAMPFFIPLSVAVVAGDPSPARPISGRCATCWCGPPAAPASCWQKPWC